uniref:Insulin-like domain-containing protein n=1 Tax=Plectus sambesii TaxID=2011161 RepID=A0A914WGF6_9BILA
MYAQRRNNVSHRSLWIVCLVACYLCLIAQSVDASQSENDAFLARLREKAPVKRGVRLCGMRLVHLVTKLCNHCVIAPDFSERLHLVDKKSESSHEILKRSGLAEQCCHNRCDFSDLKMYCCK